MKNIGYYNGTFAPLEELMVPACDRGYYFGDGAYEAIRVENHEPFALMEHVNRLYSSLESLRIDFTMPKEELCAVIRKVGNRVDSDTQQLYFQVTRGTAIRVHHFADGTTPNLMVFSRHYPLADIEHPRSVIVLPDLRWQRSNIKSLNLLPNVMAAQQARDKGCFEAILHRDGVVTECSSANLVMLKDGALVTAPTDEHIIPGVTRGHFLMLAREMGLPVVEKAFTLEQAFDADELMIMSTSVHGALIASIDGKPVCGKATALARRLQNAFRAFFWKSLQKA